MDHQKCINCAAPMVLKTNKDGTSAYHCEYCGYRLDIRPQTTSDKLFAFANRIANTLESKGVTLPVEEKKKTKTTLAEKMDELERAKKIIEQRKNQLYDRAKKWGF